MNTEVNYDSMGKNQLRAACKEAGVKGYGSMTNDGMRAALRAATQTKKQEETEIVVSSPGLRNPGDVFGSALNAAKLAIEGTEQEQEQEQEQETPVANPFGALITPVAAPTSNTPTQRVVDGKKVENRTAPVRGTRTPVAPAPYVPRVIRKGYTIQKEREERNGVKRPSEGTVCGNVWAVFDAQPNVQAKDLPAIADANGWNRTNVSCEYYAWRKFMGIKGRQVK